MRAYARVSEMTASPQLLLKIEPICISFGVLHSVVLTIHRLHGSQKAIV